jgi:hypothetical protein
MAFKGIARQTGCHQNKLTGSPLPLERIDDV